MSQSTTMARTKTTASMRSACTFMDIAEVKLKSLTRLDLEISRRNKLRSLMDQVTKAGALNDQQSAAFEARFRDIHRSCEQIAVELGWLKMATYYHNCAALEFSADIVKSTLNECLKAIEAYRNAPNSGVSSSGIVDNHNEGESSESEEEKETSSVASVSKQPMSMPTLNALVNSTSVASSSASVAKQVPSQAAIAAAAAAVKRLAKTQDKPHDLPQNPPSRVTSATVSVKPVVKGAKKSAAETKSKSSTESKKKSAAESVPKSTKKSASESGQNSDKKGAKKGVKKTASNPVPDISPSTSAAGVTAAKNSHVEKTVVPSYFDGPFEQLFKDEFMKQDYGPHQVSWLGLPKGPEVPGEYEFNKTHLTFYNKKIERRYTFGKVVVSRRFYNNEQVEAWEAKKEEAKEKEKQKKKEKQKEKKKEKKEKKDKQKESE